MGHSSAVAYQLCFGFQPGFIIQQHQVLLNILFFNFYQIHSRGNAKRWENREEALQ